MSHRSADATSVGGEFPIVPQIALKRTRVQSFRRIRIRRGIRSGERAAAHRESTWREIDRHCAAVGHTSGSDRCLIQPATVHLPTIGTEARAGGARAYVWRAPVVCENSADDLRGLAVVELEHAAEPFTASYWARSA
jgi:hypothetical protein